MSAHAVAYIVMPNPTVQLVHGNNRPWSEWHVTL